MRVDSPAGHCEGDTLVINTIGTKNGPFATLHFYGTPYTGALHVIERYRLVDDSAIKEGQERGLKENSFLPDGVDGMVADLVRAKVFSSNLWSRMGASSRPRT